MDPSKGVDKSAPAVRTRRGELAVCTVGLAPLRLGCYTHGRLATAGVFIPDPDQVTPKHRYTLLGSRLSAAVVADLLRYMLPVSVLYIYVHEACLAVMGFSGAPGGGISEKCSYDCGLDGY